jgi:hypothetical protein
MPPHHPPRRSAQSWRKPKRKRGRSKDKDGRRQRLEWRDIDKEWRVFQQRWMKHSDQPGKKPLRTIRPIEFK